jgi:hypothetical protein
MPIAARVGIARPTFAAPIASRMPRRVWPTHSPIGNAITSAIAMDASEIATCSARRIGMPVGPVQ